MLRVQWVLALLVVGLLGGIQGCAGTSADRMIDQHDHAGLANYYSQQAQEFRDKAKHWEFTAEFYDKHAEPDAKAAAQHVAHCRTIAQNYRKAADEADALATEHRAMRPHGMVQ